jgi:Ca2+-binding EF-hand superfamily protein
MTEPEIEAMLTKYDVNNSRNLDLNEFMVLMAPEGSEIPKNLV